MNNGSLPSAGGGRKEGPYRLILSEVSTEVTRVISENIFIDNLPEDYQVYLFYYPSAMLNVELENNLRNVGNLAGKNLFVNIGRLNDPKYYKMRNTFGIRELPVIVLTGIDALASLKHNGDYSTAYIRIDSKNIISSVELTVKCIERLFNLFIGGEIARAIEQAKRDQYKAIISMISSVTHKAIREFISERDITISLFGGKLELKRRI